MPVAGGIRDPILKACWKSPILRRTRDNCVEMRTLLLYTSYRSYISHSTRQHRHLRRVTKGKKTGAVYLLRDRPIYFTRCDNESLFLFEIEQTSVLKRPNVSLKTRQSQTCYITLFMMSWSKSVALLVVRECKFTSYHSTIYWNAISN